MNKESPFTEDSAERKKFPVYSGFMKYFPLAIAWQSRLSYEGNKKHNPDEELYWNRDKSGDELDALFRHAIDVDWVEVAWRANANAQKELEKGWRPSWWKGKA